MENIHGLFQLSSGRRYRRREDILLSRRPQPRSPIDGTDQTHNATDGRAWPGSAVRSAVVGPRQRPDGLGREWQGCVVHVRGRGGRQVLAQARLRSDLSGAPGRRGRLRVLRQEATRHALLGAQLLWYVNFANFDIIGNCGLIYLILLFKIFYLNLLRFIIRSSIKGIK